VPLEDLAPGTDPPSAPASIPATLHLQVQSDLESARAELSRLNRLMRARDSYLLELERALEQNAQLLRTLGLEGADDAAELHGRLRGQMFRIAELEAELQRRDAAQQLEPERDTEVRPRPAAAG
jgi:hypothetical protein